MSFFKIIYILIFIIIIGLVINEEIQFHNFKSKIHIGTKLYNIYKMIDDEFDDGHHFIITIQEIRKNRVRVTYQDGSQSQWDIRQLFNENWKFKYELH